MKQYKVIVTPDAEEDLESYVAYLRQVKKSARLKDLGEMERK